MQTVWSIACLASANCHERLSFWHLTQFIDVVLSKGHFQKRSTLQCVKDHIWEAVAAGIVPAGSCVFTPLHHRVHISRLWTLFWIMFPQCWGSRASCTVGSVTPSNSFINNNKSNLFILRWSPYVARLAWNSLRSPADLNLWPQPE